ncbi:MAG: hypothetical protein ACT4OU_00300 [Hyphomicrobium sp.]
MKASFKLPNGATIEVEGSIDEVKAVSDHAAKYPPVGSPASSAVRPASSAAAWQPSAHQSSGDAQEAPAELNIASVVAIIKDCPEAETIQARVLDASPLNAVHRTLMCLWAVSKYVNDQLGITSGDIERITDQLGIKLDISGASRVLSDKAKAYVSGDVVRRKGGAVRYKLNRRGIAEFERILNGGAAN